MHLYCNTIHFKMVEYTFKLGHILVLISMQAHTHRQTDTVLFIHMHADTLSLTNRFHFLHVSG